MRTVATIGKGEHAQVSRMVAETRPPLEPEHPDLASTLLALGATATWTRFELEASLEGCKAAWELIGGRPGPTSVRAAS